MKIAARIILAALALVLGLVGYAFLASPKARAETAWGRWNIAPYAKSFAEACKKAPMAIDGFALPQAVKERFKQALGADCKGGATVWLVPHQRLEEMWSGGAKPHVMKNVTVAELPVLESPDGRAYRSGAVAETAKALSWTVVHEGKAYTLYLPFACFNWSWNFAPAPVVVAEKKEECATVKYTVAAGDEVRFAALSRRRLPASACWQLCDGADCAAPPSPCDTCEWAGSKSVIPAGFEALHTGRYVAHAVEQLLRFPLEAKEGYVALCVERAGLGQSDSWVVQPSAWGGGMEVAVPYGGQQWPAWGQVDPSKWQKP